MKELKMFIDGRFIEHESGKWIKVLNPSTEEVISLMPDGTVEDAKRAIDAAEKAQGQWERTPSIERAAYLTKIAAGIRKREKELTDIIVREGGKTQGLANVEVLFTADYIDYMAGWARRYEGEIIPSDRPRESIFLFKKAIGVTTGILPWNFHGRFGLCEPPLRLQGGVPPRVQHHQTVRQAAAAGVAGVGPDPQTGKEHLHAGGRAAGSPAQEPALTPA